MVHITCDLCGKTLQNGEHHFVVKIEVFTAHDPGEITEEDLDEDHMEAISQMLQEMEDMDDPIELPPASQQFRYDLCPACRKKYLQAPLSKDAAVNKFDFSEN